MNEPPGARRQVAHETFEAVLFDSDSTLIDSGGAVQRSWEAWAQRYGVPLERLGDTHGMPSHQTIARVARDLDLELDADEAAATSGALELADVEDVVVLPGAQEALAAVGERGAVVTSAGRTLLRRRLQAAGITPPRVLVTADDVTRGKPDPEPYLEGARRLGVDIRRCLVVEDSVAGVASGRAAGAATLALLTTTGRDRLIEADLVVRDLSWVRFQADADGVRVTLPGVV